MAWSAQLSQSSCDLPRGPASPPPEASGRAPELHGLGGLDGAGAGWTAPGRVVGDWAVAEAGWRRARRRAGTRGGPCRVSPAAAKRRARRRGARSEGSRRRPPPGSPPGAAAEGSGRPVRGGREAAAGRWAVPGGGGRAPGGWSGAAGRCARDPRGDAARGALRGGGLGQGAGCRAGAPGAAWGGPRRGGPGAGARVTPRAPPRGFRERALRAGEWERRRQRPWGRGERDGGTWGAAAAQEGLRTRGRGSWRFQQRGDGIR